MNLSSYMHLRTKIKNGHLVFFGAHTWKQKLITFFTGGSFSHCGLAVWLTDGVEDRLMLVEATHGGRRIVSLSSYCTRPFTVIDINLPYCEIANEALSQTGMVAYGYFDLLTIGVRDLMLRLGLKSHLPNTEGEVCSEFLAHTLKDAGVELSDLLLSPTDLFVELEGDNKIIAEYTLK